MQSNFQIEANNPISLTTSANIYTDKNSLQARFTLISLFWVSNQF